jgi:hypothetical protein
MPEQRNGFETPRQNRGIAVDHCGQAFKRWSLDDTIAVPGFEHHTSCVRHAMMRVHRLDYPRLSKSRSQFDRRQSYWRFYRLRYSLQLSGRCLQER